MFFSPLEQFEIYPLITIKFLFFDFSLTNLVVFKIFLVCLIYFIFYIFSNYMRIFPKIWQFILVKLLFFVQDLIVENVNKYNKIYFYPIFCIFLFILLSNLLGMIPFTFAITSHFTITFFLSISIFFYLNIVGISKHGFAFFKLFLPEGAPFLIIPFLVIIEFISYFARVFSLAIRLFANIMAGHTLLHILAGFAWVLLASFWSFLGPFPLIIVFVVTFLEFAIGFLQAYVFTILTCIYIHDALSLHH